jgi:PAS domain S-box-containing protein
MSFCHKITAAVANAADPFECLLTPETNPTKAAAGAYARSSYGERAARLLPLGAATVFLLLLADVGLEIWLRPAGLLPLVWVFHLFAMLLCIIILATIIIPAAWPRVRGGKEAERKLARSELTLRTIVDTSLDAIGISTLPDLRFVQVNKAFEQMFGHSRTEFIGHVPSEFAFGPDETAYQNFSHEILSEGSVRNMEFPGFRRNGQPVAMQVSAVMVELEGALCAIWMMRDITTLKQTEHKLRAEVVERARIEQALRESEATFRKIIESSPDPVSINRYSDGTYLHLSSSFETSGYRVEEVTGKSSFRAGLWADKAQYKQYIATLNERKHVSNMEVSFRLKDGAEVPCLLSSALVELKGEPCIVSFSRDITKIKRTERELVQTREAALAASRAKSEFLSSMSHEIRTPMNAILGMAELLAETPLDHQQQKFLNIMQNNGNALLELINDILDLAKVESGRLNLEQRPFELDALMEKVAETLGMRAHAAGLELIARVVPGTPLNLLGDSLRLRQILVNLIGNAIKFTARGEIVLAVESDRESGEPGRLHFSVSDTGIGIAEERIDHIFHKFTQADSSITRRYGGSGLGLAIVARLVALMDGRVWVESKVGQGSTFHFTARFTIESVPKLPKPAFPDSPLVLNGMRMLIVDDNATNRLLLREILTPLGASVTEAKSGTEAVAEIEHARSVGNPYRLMLLDCQMPGMDGFQVMERLNGPNIDETVVLMLTSDDLSLSEPRIREMKLDTYLVKPVRRQELLEAIGAALASRHRAVGVNESAANKSELQAPASEQKTLLQETPAIAARAANILLADDSADNRLLIENYLKHTPYSLESAENGKVAVEKFMARRFDLVLMDVQMPVMDGLEAITVIREWESRQGMTPTPIIALTASALTEDAQYCLNIGATVHVPKPVKKSALLTAIQKLLPCGHQIAGVANHVGS